MQFGACYGRTIIFYPVHLTLFSVISMERRNTSGVFIQILWLVSLIWLLATIWRDGFSNITFFDRKWCKQHKCQQAERKLFVQLRAENHSLLESGEARTCSVGRNPALVFPVKPWTPEKMSGMFIVSRPIRFGMKPQKITAKPQHGVVTTWRETTSWLCVPRQIFMFTVIKCWTCIECFHVTSSNS